MSENRKAEDIWATMHCTSVLLKVISKKRIDVIENNSADFSISKNILSIANFKERNIELFVSMISSRSLKFLSEKIINDMYKFDFDNSSSVDSKIEGLTNNSNLEALMSISLLQHSFGVLNIMNQIIGKKFGLYSDLFFIAGLVHDFGKSGKLKNSYGIDKDISHHEASAIYLKKLIHIDKNISNYYKKLLNLVCEVFEAHHSRNVENLFYATKKEEDSKELQILLMKYLKESDLKQREFELELLKK